MKVFFLRKVLMKFILLLFLISFQVYSQTPSEIAKNTISQVRSETDQARKLLLLEKAETQLLTELTNWNDIQKVGGHKFLTLDPEGMYQGTYSSWLDSYEKKKYRKILKSLVDKDFSVLTKKNIKFINTYRRQTHFLRMTFNMFDEAHIPPEGLQKFVVHSGRLKDLIDIAKKSDFKSKTGKLQEKAIMLLELYDKFDLKQEAESIRFISNDDFKEYFRRICDSIYHELSKPELTVEEFHSVRKKVKEIQFALKDIIDNSPKATHLVELFDEIDQIRSEMGDVHTMYIKLKYFKEIEYTKHTIKMSQTYKDAMESLIKVGEKNICSVKFANFSKMIN